MVPYNYYRALAIGIREVAFFYHLKFQSYIVNSYITLNDILGPSCKYPETTEDTLWGGIDTLANCKDNDHNRILQKIHICYIK